MNSFEIGDRDRTNVQPIDTSWRILGDADTLEDDRQAICELVLNEIDSLKGYCAKE